MKKFQFISLVFVFVLSFSYFTHTAGANDNRCINNNWEVLYTIEFPPGYWTAGPHENELQTIDEYGTTIYYFYFTSSEDAPLYPGQVRIGFWGIHSIDQIGLNIINPAQDSFMQVSLTDFPTREDAVAYADSAIVQFRWDGGNWVSVDPGPINCAPDAWSGQKGYYHRQWNHQR